MERSAHQVETFDPVAIVEEYRRVMGRLGNTTKHSPPPPMVEGVICTTAGTDADPHCVHVLRRNGG
jgi:hypothetical protein